MLYSINNFAAAEIVTLNASYLLSNDIFFNQFTQIYAHILLKRKLIKHCFIYELLYHLQQFLYIKIDFKVACGSY